MSHVKRVNEKKGERENKISFLNLSFFFIINILNKKIIV